MHSVDRKKEKTGRTRLIRLGPLLQPIHIVIKLLGPSGPFIQTLFLDILVVALEQFLFRRSDGFDEERSPDAYHGTATYRFGE